MATSGSLRGTVEGIATQLREQDVAVDSNRRALAVLEEDTVRAGEHAHHTALQVENHEPLTSSGSVKELQHQQNRARAGNPSHGAA